MPAASTTSLPSRPFSLTLPSLDYRNTQVAQSSEFWPGATSATPYSIQKALPTPPSAEDGAFKPPGLTREVSGNGTAATGQQLGLPASNMEHNGPASSFTARRSAASNLPNFELPPMPQLSGQQKYPAYPINLNTTQAPPANVNIGNLLTPPSQVPGDSLSPISSGLNSNNSAAAQGLPPFTPTGFGWPPPATGMTPNISTGTGTTPQPWSQGPPNPLVPGRGVFSPSLGSLMRNSTGSPTASEGLPPPPFDFNTTPFTQTSMAAPAAVTLPAISAQQQQQQQQNHQQAQQHAMVSTYSMGMPTPVSAISAPSQASPTDSYPSQRQPPTPTNYNGSQPSYTPQQSQFPTFAGSSPVQQSPIGSGPTASRVSPTNGHPPNVQTGLSQQAHNFPRATYGQYQASPGPVLTNVHCPNGQVSMMSPMPPMMQGNVQYPFNSGHAAMQQAYGQHHTPHNERPFKCDACPQSFNRNHDLKRHKRIHLAVKPFPCGHCDKSFSRKDALKVRYLISLLSILANLLIRDTSL